MSQKKLTFLLLCLANLTISFNFASLAAVISPMSRDLAESAISVSRILHYYMIPYGLGALIYPPLARRLNFKNIVLLSILLYSLSNVICATVSSLPVILAARIFMGLSAASIIPITLIVIGRSFEKNVRGRMVGMFFSTSFVASVLGLLVSGVSHWRWLFIVPAVFGLFLALVMMIIRSPELAGREEATINYFKVLNDRRLQPILVFIFVISFLYHGVHKWFGLYFDQIYHFKQMTVSGYFMLIALSGAIGQNVGGYLTDWQGRMKSTQLGVGIMALSTMALIGIYPNWVLAIILAGFSIGWTIGHNGISTVLTDLPDETRAEIAGLNSAIRFFSGGLGFFVGGPFVERNFGFTFFGFGIIMLLSVFFIKAIIPQKNSFGNN